MGSIESILLSYGAPGVIILVLILTIKALDKRNEVIQEKRIAEGREAVTAIEKNTAALESLADILRDRKNA